MDTSSALSGWWYVSNGKRQGPVNEQELQRLMIGGTLGPQSLVWKQGMQRWQHLGQVQTLSDRLASLPPDLPPALPRTNGENSPNGSPQTATSPGVIQRAGRNAAANKKGYARWRFILLSFRGRIDRETYWLGTVVLYLVMLFVALVPASLIVYSQSGGPAAGTLLVFGGFSIAGMILAFIGGIAIAVKRLHDFDWSGWWTLLYFLPLFLSLPYLFPPDLFPPAAQVLASLVGLLVFITLGAVRGTIGPNRYGPDAHWRADLR